VTQPDLFATNAVGEAVVRDVWSPSTPAQEAREEQARQLARVSGKLEPAMLDVLRRWGAGHYFTAAELASAVSETVPLAQDSASRILRLLRQKGLVSYRCASRRPGCCAPPRSASCPVTTTGRAVVSPGHSATSTGPAPTGPRWLWWEATRRTLTTTEANLDHLQEVRRHQDR
jgi:hypothetical protein